MLQLSEQVVIDAPPEKVFDVIADFGRYAQWNPWVCEAAGEAREGEIVRVKARLGSTTARVRHRVLTSRRAAEFRWCDLGWFTALAYGERARFIEPAPGGGARYRVELRITGVAARLVQALYGRALASGLKAETDALKQRAESLA
jgi:uncharacterized protein YndB with AHSA1/START domain